MTPQQRMRTLAYNWHGGGGSPLYQFASTGGVVHTDEHREKLVAEVQEYAAWCEASPEAREAADLPALRELLASVSAVRLNAEPCRYPGR